MFLHSPFLLFVRTRYLFHNYFLKYRLDIKKCYLVSSLFFCSSSFFLASISRRFFVKGFPSLNSRHLASINLDMYPDTIPGLAYGGEHFMRYCSVHSMKPPLDLSSPHVQTNKMCPYLLNLWPYHAHEQSIVCEIQVICMCILQLNILQPKLLTQIRRSLLAIGLKVIHGELIPCKMLSPFQERF